MRQEKHKVWQGKTHAILVVAALLDLVGSHEADGRDLQLQVGRPRKAGANHAAAQDRRVRQQASNVPRYVNSSASKLPNPRRFPEIA